MPHPSGVLCRKGGQHNLRYLGATGPSHLGTGDSALTRRLAGLLTRWLAPRFSAIIKRGHPCAAISKCSSTSIRPPRQMKSATRPCSLCARSAGSTSRRKANEAAFAKAIDEIAAACQRLFSQLQTQAPPRNREDEAAEPAPATSHALEIDFATLIFLSANPRQIR